MFLSEREAAQAAETEARYAAHENEMERQRYAADSGKITPAQRLFIDMVAAGIPMGQAYQQCYPKSAVNSAHSSASRLMDRPSIQRAINDARQAQSNMKAEKVRAPILHDMEELKQQRFMLKQIITGEILSKTTVRDIDTGATKVRMHEDPMAIIQAIKLDIKLAELLAHAHAQLPDDPNDTILELYEDGYASEGYHHDPEHSDTSGPYKFVNEEEDDEDDDLTEAELQHLLSLKNENSSKNLAKPNKSCENTSEVCDKSNNSAPPVIETTVTVDAKTGKSAQKTNNAPSVKAKPPKKKDKKE